MKVKNESEVALLCLTPSNRPWDLPGKSTGVGCHCLLTTGQTIALTIWTFVGTVMSLLLNVLSRFVIGEDNGNPLQYSCLENPMDGGAW